MLTRQLVCFVAGVHQLRNLFQSLDKDGSGSVSRFEFREFLKPYNLNLSEAALTALVDLFDDPVSPRCLPLPDDCSSRTCACFETGPDDICLDFSGHVLLISQ